METSKLEIVEEIREDLGDPDETELPESFIVRTIENGLTYFNKSVLKRKKAYASLDIVTDQDIYDLSENTALKRVTDVYFIDKAYYNINPETFATYFSNSNLDLASLYDSPALSYLFFQKLSSLDLLFPTDFEFLNMQLRIIPTPQENSTILYEYITDISLEDIAKDDLEILKKFVLAKSMLRIGRKRNSKVRGIPMVGGEIRFDDGSAMIKEGNSLMEKFRKELGLDLPAISTG